MNQTTRRSLALLSLAIAIVYFALVLYANYAGSTYAGDLLTAGAILFLFLIFAELLVLPQRKRERTIIQDSQPKTATGARHGSAPNGVIEHLPPEEQRSGSSGSKCTVQDGTQAPVDGRDLLIKCPTCSEEFIIEDGARPIRTRCPSCGAEGLLR